MMPNSIEFKMIEHHLMYHDKYVPVSHHLLNKMRLDVRAKLARAGKPKKIAKVKRRA